MYIVTSIEFVEDKVSFIVFEIFLRLLIKFFITLCFTLTLAFSHWSVLANDKSLDLSQYQGKVVYVDFWASWCSPCLKSFPFMNQLVEKHQADDFVLIAVNLDSETELANNFLKKHPANFDIIYDPAGKIAERFQLEAMPTSYLFNKAGKAVYRHQGFRKKDIAKIKSQINNLLGASE